MTLNKTAWLLVFLMVISSFLIFVLYQKTDDGWLISYWGVIGSNASIFGIIYTIISIRQLRTETEIIALATSETKQKLEAFHGVADVAKGIKLVQEIQGCARIHKYEVGIIRLQELKIIISQIKSKEMIPASVDVLDSTVYDLNRFINSMEKEISAKTSNLKIIEVNKTLEKISDLLVGFQSSIIKGN